MAARYVRPWNDDITEIKAINAASAKSGVKISKQRSERILRKLNNIRQWVVRAPTSAATAGPLATIGAASRDTRLRGVELARKERHFELAQFAAHRKKGRIKLRLLLKLESRFEADIKIVV